MTELNQFVHGPDLVWEPRHISWGSPLALKTFAEHGISKVQADPERCPVPQAARLPVETTRYLRLHGTPDIYRSRYSETVIKRIAVSLVNPLCAASQSWTIFDNTTVGYATVNALELQTQIKQLAPA